MDYTIHMKKIVIALFMLVAMSVPAHADHAVATWPQSIITVETEPGIDIPEVIRPWNKMAGRELLRAVPPGQPADIKWSKHEATWVKWYYAGRKMYDCRIHYSHTTTYVMQHELGHCLGFYDHVRVPDPWGRTTWRQCNRPDLPYYSHYRGVMAYCGFRNEAYRNWRWFGAADVDMLRRAYR